MSFVYLSLLKPNEHTEDYHIRKPNDENILLEIEDKKYGYVEEKVDTFETTDIIVNYSSDHVFNVNKFPFA